MLIYIIFALNALLFASVLFLITAGLNIVYGVMRIINLAHGNLYALGAYVTAWVLLTIGYSAFPGPLLYIVPPLIGAAVVGLGGLIMEPTLLRPMYKRIEEFQLLVTFGVLLVLEDLFLLLFGPYPLSVREPYSFLGVTKIGDLSYPNYNFLVIALGFIIAFVLWFFLYRTKFGTILRATSLDREMAAAMGVNVKALFTVSFIIGSMIAGLAGGFIVAKDTAVLGMGIEALVLAFVVMVIGGLGSLKGAFIGALIVGVVRQIGTAFFPEIELAVLWLIAAIVLTIKPQGLFGR
ncbi:MAG TPA: branched-chain amino acid ABC transporter permease [Candidatus Caldiarchaeum subterraneum]|uniref:Branched-chain amino acid ABC transporter permease n=1 Tax=Caldiarchaeum subterraneum TaxID=311458 RepID=A0A833ECD7_CALS0|nr:branched-chain amino acid ABC transporter permease [Candidatus Caldarchaeum subterraneum]